MNNLAWSFNQVWNQSLEQREDRPLQPRQRIWSSELGGSYVDRWLKMKAEPFTNPADPRARRKFEAGNLFEWIVQLILKRAGILKDSQTWASFQYPDLLQVTGKTDFIAGGLPDWNKAIKMVEAMKLPEFFTRATEAIIDHFKSNYSEGLREILLEIKSCSSFMYDRYDKVGASINHSLQLYHCLKALNYEEGHIVYISKDDLRMLEIGIFNLNGSEIEKTYKADIEAMTYYVNADEQPPLERMIVFEKGKFSKNWKIEYSYYLTKLYGIKTPAEYDSEYAPIVASWNRVMKRITKGDKMTVKNLAIIEDIKKEYPDFMELAKQIDLSEEELEETEVK